LAKILIVDDDLRLNQSFERLLSQEGHTVQTAASGEAGLSMVKEDVPDLAVIDVRLPGMNGLETFQAMHEIESKLPIIIMTAFGTTDTAIEATKLGAFDYVLKPFHIPDILALIAQALEAGGMMRSGVEMNGIPEVASGDALIGRSKQMQVLYKDIGRVAPTDATVLIRGESGTGKELVARALYQHSLRKEKSFLVINCVAIPETLLESELFGYERGAFTGAVHRRIGKIEQAGGGSVFLDEIGDMPLSIQAKILRLLQEKSLERLGGREIIPVDVRIIAATNRDLEKAVAEGRFREDLYYRIKVVTLHIPPLRDRKEDISLLADYFLERFANEMNVANPGMMADAKKMLDTYHWPGNVRELANIIQKVLIFSRGGTIGPGDVAQAIWGDRSLSYDAGEKRSEHIREWIREILASEHENLFGVLTDRFASILISEVLAFTGGNRTRTAELLGLSRPTLLSKIKKYRIRLETSVADTDS
jgi:DNA-binding NtrC family response regulator